MTTLSSKNPAYRIYTIDGGYEGASYVSALIHFTTDRIFNRKFVSFQTVLDAETYSTDINEANTNGHEPEWFLEYSAKVVFSV